MSIFDDGESDESCNKNNEHICVNCTWEYSNDISNNNSLSNKNIDGGVNISDTSEMIISRNGDDVN